MVCLNLVVNIGIYDKNVSTLGKQNFHEWNILGRIEDIYSKWYSYMATLHILSDYCLDTNWVY